MLFTMAPPASLLVFISTLLLLPPPAAALPVPATFRLSSRTVQHFLTVPLPQRAPELRIVDDAYVHWVSSHPAAAFESTPSTPLSEEKEMTLDSDSIFSDASDDEVRRGSTRTAKKVVKAMKKAEKSLAMSLSATPTLTSSAPASLATTPAVLGSPESVHVGSISYDPLTFLSTDCPSLLLTTPTGAQSVTLSASIFSDTLCGAEVVLTNPSTGVSSIARVSGKCEACVGEDLDVSKGLLDEFTVQSEEDQTYEAAIEGIEWRFV